MHAAHHASVRQPMHARIVESGDLVSAPELGDAAADSNDFAAELPRDAVVVAHIVALGVAPIDATDDAEYSVVEADMAQIDGEIAAVGGPARALDHGRVALPGAAPVTAAQADRRGVVSAAGVVGFRLERLAVSPPVVDGVSEIVTVTEVDDGVVVAQVDLFAFMARPRAQPVEDLIDGAVVVPDPLVLIVGPGLAVVEGAAQHDPRFAAPAFVGVPRVAWPSGVALPGLVVAVIHGLVIHGDGGVGDGDLAVTEVPDTAAIGGVEVHVRVAVDDDVARVLDLHLAHADSSSR